jgi:hypothetical protein
MGLISTSSTSPNSPHKAGRQDASGDALSPELVRAVADLVYAMLRRDLKLEQERERFRGEEIRHNGQGGRSC